MSEEILKDTPTDQFPLCPQCRHTLYPYGAVIEKWGFLHWVEAWHCPVHGAVVPYRNKDGKQDDSVP